MKEGTLKTNVGYYQAGKIHFWSLGGTKKAILASDYSKDDFPGYVYKAKTAISMDFGGEGHVVLQGTWHRITRMQGNVLYKTGEVLRFYDAGKEGGIFAEKGTSFDDAWTGEFDTLDEDVTLQVGGKSFRFMAGERISYYDAAKTK